MWKRSIRVGLSAYLTMRLLTIAAALFALSAMEIGPTVPVPGYRAPAYDGLAAVFLEPWLRSDALWYLKAATIGYVDQQTFAFFPAFPLLTRIVNIVVGDELVAGLLVANVCAAGGLVVAHRMFAELIGEPRGDAATWALALFPTSFFLVAPYAEPVLLMSGSAALLMAMRRRFGLSAAWAAIAALSRPFGVLLAIALAAAVVRERTERPKLYRWLPVVAAVGAVAIWGLVMAVATGNPSALVSVQGMWQREATFPLVTLIKGFQAVFTYRGTGYSLYMAMDLVAVSMVAFMVGWCLVRWRRGEPGLAGPGLYGVAALLVPLSSMFAGRPLLSFPRFALGFFPCLAATGRPKRWVGLALAVSSGLGLFIATCLFVAARPLY